MATSKNLMAVHEMKLFCVSQALQLLRASLTTSSALNEVFSKSEFLNLVMKLIILDSYLQATLSLKDQVSTNSRVGYMNLVYLEVGKSWIRCHSIGFSSCVGMILH